MHPVKMSGMWCKLVLVLVLVRGVHMSCLCKLVLVLVHGVWFQLTPCTNLHNLPDTKYQTPRTSLHQITQTR